jgi:dTDP-4-amino-4,6-dideoxygalactose transaminase
MCYLRGLKTIPEIQPILPGRYVNQNYHLFVVKAQHRDRLVAFLKEKGIPTLIHYPSLITDQPFMIEHNPPVLPEASLFIRQILSLPCHPFMTVNEAQIVIDEIKHFYRSL